jgi:integrase
MRKVETVTKDGNATAYKVRFRHGISPRTGKPMQTSESFELTRAGYKLAADFAKWIDALGVTEALARLEDVERQAGVPTLNDVAAEWIELRPNANDGTKLNYVRLWDRTWGPLIGHLPANRLDEDDLSRAVINLGKTYSRKSLENQRGLLSGVIGRAVRKGHLAENIARGMPLPAGKHGRRKEMRILTTEDFAGVDELIPEHYRTFVRTLYASGLRWGEAVTLEVQDWIKPNLHVRQALKWSPDNKRVIGEPKTDAGARAVTVTPELHDELDALAAGRPGDEFLFRAPRGGPILHRTFWSRVWLPAVEHLSPRPRIHDLRHSHASILLARGIPIHVVSRRLGHSKIQVTVDTYGHLLPDAQMLAAQASSFAFTPTAIES